MSMVDGCDPCHVNTLLLFLTSITFDLPCMINIIKLLKIQKFRVVQMGVVWKWWFITSGGMVNLGISGHYLSTVEVGFICWGLCT